MLQRGLHQQHLHSDLVGINRGPHAAHCSYAPPTPSFVLRISHHTSIHLKCFAEQKPFTAMSDLDLPEDIASSWIECSDRLISLGLQPDVAEKTIAKAYGWGGQGYWRHAKAKETPTVERVEAVLEFLSAQGLTAQEDQVAMILKFPEVLGLELIVMEGNVEKLKKSFFLKGPALIGVLKRKPRVLGTVVDCEGTCQGYCTRCFANF